MKVSDENVVIYDARSKTLSFSSGIEMLNFGKLASFSVNINNAVGGNLPNNALNLEL